MSLNDVLALIAALLPVLIPLGLFVYHLLMAHLPANRASAIEQEVNLIVRAVEQTYKAVPGSGAYKKAEVMRLAAHFGLKVDPARLDALIEAAVASLPK